MTIHETSSIANLDVLNDAMGQAPVDEALTALTIITLPLLLGLILDWNTNIFQIKKECVIFCSRACLGVAFLVLSILAHHQQSRNRSWMSPSLFLCLVTGLKNVLAATLMGCVSASSGPKSAWMPWKSSWITALTVSAHLLRMFFTFHQNIPALFVAYVFLFILDFVSLLVFVGQWIWYGRDHWLPHWVRANSCTSWSCTSTSTSSKDGSPSSRNNPPLKAVSPDDISSVLYFVAFIVGLFGSPILLSSATNPLGLLELATPERLAGAVYVFVGVFIVITAIPGRVAHKEQLLAKDAIIGSKNTFLSYISHEMRCVLLSVQLSRGYGECTFA